MDDVQVVLFNEELDILCYVTRGHASPNKDITKILQNAIHKILSIYSSSVGRGVEAGSSKTT